MKILSIGKKIIIIFIILLVVLTANPKQVKDDLVFDLLTTEEKEKEVERLRSEFSTVLIDYYQGKANLHQVQNLKDDLNNKIAKMPK